MSSLNDKMNQYDVYIAFDPSESTEQITQIREKLRNLINNEEQFDRLIELLGKELSAVIARKIPIEAAQEYEEKYTAIGMLVELKEINEPYTRKLTLEPQEQQTVAEKPDTLNITEEPRVEKTTTTSYMIDGSTPSNSDTTPQKSAEKNQQNTSRVPPIIHKKTISSTTSPAPKSKKKQRKENSEVTTKQSKTIFLLIPIALLLAAGTFALGRYILPAQQETAVTPTPVVAAIKQATPNKPGVPQNTKKSLFNAQSADSLVYISQLNKNQRRYESNITPLYLLNQSLSPQQTPQSPLLHMPDRLKDNLLLKYIDTLLYMHQADRAQDVYQHAQKTWAGMAQSQYLAQANIHILAHQTLQNTGVEKLDGPLYKAIEALSNDKKIEASLYVVQTAAHYGLPLDKHIESTEALISELGQKDERKALYYNSLLNIHQAEALYYQALSAQHQGRWGQVQAVYNQLLRFKIKPDTALGEFVINLLRYNLSLSLHNSSQADIARKKVSSAAGGLTTLQESRQALLYWNTHLKQADQKINSEIFKQLEPIIASRLAVDEEALILSQICQKIQNKECIVRIGNRAFDDANIPPTLVNHFGLQNLFNNTLSNAQEAYYQGDMAQAEAWLVRGINELF